MFFGWGWVKVWVILFVLKYVGEMGMRLVLKIKGFVF